MYIEKFPSWMEDSSILRPPQIEPLSQMLAASLKYREQYQEFSDVLAIEASEIMNIAHSLGDTLYRGSLFPAKFESPNEKYKFGDFEVTRFLMSNMVSYRPFDTSFEISLTNFKNDRSRFYELNYIHLIITSMPNTGNFETHLLSTGSVTADSFTDTPLSSDIQVHPLLYGLDNIILPSRRFPNSITLTNASRLSIGQLTDLGILTSAITESLKEKAERLA